MKTTKLNLATLFLLLSLASIKGQGFINLNFEQANVSAYGAGPAFVPSTNAIPGWTAYTLGNPQTSVLYNSVTLGAPSVDLESTNIGYAPIQGRFFILLQGGTPQPGVSAAIGQNGQIPISAQSAIFWGNGDLNVTFAGQALAFNQTGSTANFGIFTADVSAYAGQTGQLLFTAVGGTSLFLDNIQFSSVPVPESSALALTAIGAAWLGFRRWKK